MAWTGIPKFMHKRQISINLNNSYVCGATFHAWSQKWMESKSDVCEIDGETMYRFTAGDEIVHLPVCPTCWSDIPIDTPISIEVYEDIEILEFEATEVVEDVEDADVDDADQSSLSPIFLWDFIKV